MNGVTSNLSALTGVSKAGCHSIMGMSWTRLECIVHGSQVGSKTNWFARSAINSVNTENSPAAGDEPNGSRNKIKANPINIVQHSSASLNRAKHRR